MAPHTLNLVNRDAGYPTCQKLYDFWNLPKVIFLDKIWRFDMKKIAVVFNGGTISMKVDERIKAAVPSLTGEEIMTMVTGIEDYAEIESITFLVFHLLI